jgi:hypothetical protein
MLRAGVPAIMLVAFAASAHGQAPMPGTPSPNTPGPTNPVVQTSPSPSSLPKNVRSGSRGLTGHDEERSPVTVPALPGTSHPQPK